jgi:hypothetical protein
MMNREMTNLEISVARLRGASDNLEDVRSKLSEARSLVWRLEQAYSQANLSYEEAVKNVLGIVGT